MHADDWATHAPSATLKKAERAKIEADIKAFLKAGGKVYYAANGESSEIKHEISPSLNAGREVAKKKARANKGATGERQRKIMSAIREAMKGSDQITFEEARKVVKMGPETLRSMLKTISNNGFFKFDGETITARMV